MKRSARAMGKGTPLGVGGALVLASCAAGASAQDIAPPVDVQARPGGTAAASGPGFVVLARTDKNEVVTASDLSLALSKPPRQEQAVVRRAIYYSGSVSLTRPADLAPDDPVTETCRWTYKSYLLRQLCFTSISGVFACTNPEVVDLTERAEGQAELTVAQSASNACNEGFGAVAAARTRLVAALRLRAPELYDADQKEKVEPLFRAAGVTATRAPAPPR